MTSNGSVEGLFYRLDYGAEALAARPPSPVFGGLMDPAGVVVAIGATLVAGTVVGVGLQLMVTTVEPVAAPDVAVTVALPPRSGGAVSTERTPPVVATTEAGESVPIEVVRFTVAPAFTPLTEIAAEAPQARLSGAAWTERLAGAVGVGVTPAQLTVTWV